MTDDSVPLLSEVVGLFVLKERRPEWYATTFGDWERFITDPKPGRRFDALLARNPDLVRHSLQDLLSPHKRIQRPEAAFCLGKAYQRLAEHDAAVRTFRELLAYRKTPLVCYELAVSCHALGQIADAVRALDEAAACRPIDAGLDAQIRALRASVSVPHAPAPGADS